MNRRSRHLALSGLTPGTRRRAAASEEYGKITPAAGPGVGGNHARLHGTGGRRVRRPATGPDGDPAGV
ncbi:MAG TPA: hypothetical protein VEG33_16700, partial [Streptosporangiaceae bacterium]|nr:hypothetical protein [Streptosporangiaceae bacterium]